MRGRTQPAPRRAGAGRSAGGRVRGLVLEVDAEPAGGLVALEALLDDADVADVDGARARHGLLHAEPRVVPVLPVLGRALDQDLPERRALDREVTGVVGDV